LIEKGQIRALAKLNSHPLPQLPELKPLAELANLPTLGDFSVWSGLAAPAGTPPAIIERLQRSVAAATADPAVSDRLRRMGIYAVSSTPQAFADFVRNESGKWGKVIEESGFKMN
jgi:tripartite-type tricarboxylate transporter receptor subunit TctC